MKLSAVFFMEKRILEGEDNGALEISASGWIRGPYIFFSLSVWLLKD